MITFIMQIVYVYIYVYIYTFLKFDYNLIYFYEIFEIHKMSLPGSLILILR